MNKKDSMEFTKEQIDKVLYADEIQSKRLIDLKTELDLAKEQIKQNDKEIVDLYFKIAALEREVYIARERLGPAGWKILERYKKMEDALKKISFEGRLSGGDDCSELDYRMEIAEEALK